MRQGPNFDGDALSFQMLEALKASLQSLEDLKLVPHNEPHVLRLKQHLREMIAKTERTLSEKYEEAAA